MKMFSGMTEAGEKDFFIRQSIKSYIGMGVIFNCNIFAPHGFNYKIIKEKGGKNGRDNSNNNK
ncbi:MAG: hypothetical protein M1165_01400 [Candidatus Pacearchaeota archaeon]|jgi:hypothetical protein|nr:hypothetical protein [Candidatus Pacearchaeota archaeon]